MARGVPDLHLLAFRSSQHDARARVVLKWTRALDFDQVEHRQQSQKQFSSRSILFHSSSHIFRHYGYGAYDDFFSRTSFSKCCTGGRVASTTISIKGITTCSQRRNERCKQEDRRSYEGFPKSICLASSLPHF